jgi:hypothetical protein
VRGVNEYNGRSCELTVWYLAEELRRPFGGGVRERLWDDRYVQEPHVCCVQGYDNGRRSCRQKQCLPRGRVRKFTRVLEPTLLSNHPDDNQRLRVHLVDHSAAAVVTGETAMRDISSTGRRSIECVRGPVEE